MSIEKPSASPENADLIGNFLKRHEEYQDIDPTAEEIAAARSFLADATDEDKIKEAIDASLKDRPRIPVYGHDGLVIGVALSEQQKNRMTKQHNESYDYD